MADDIQELITQRDDYRTQLQTIATALAAGPNAELEALAGELAELISMTESLIAETQAHSNLLASAAATTAPVPGHGGTESTGASVGNMASTAQARLRFAVGDEVSAWFAGDGQWYDAKIKATTERGTYVVLFKGYKSTEDLPIESVRTVGETQVEKQAAEDKARRESRKRKRDEIEGENSDSESDGPGTKATIPEALWAKPTDTPDERALKRRKIQAIKKRHKAEQVEQAAQDKKNSWQSFVHGSKAGKRAKRATTGSMFRADEGGRVGVVGSGGGMTAFRDKKKEFGADKGRA